MIKQLTQAPVLSFYRVVDIDTALGSDLVFPGRAPTCDDSTREIEETPRMEDSCGMS